jgi:hypothetical protein
MRCGRRDHPGDEPDRNQPASGSGSAWDEKSIRSLSILDFRGDFDADRRTRHTFYLPHRECKLF